MSIVTYYTEMASPVGLLTLRGSSKGLQSLDFNEITDGIVAPNAIRNDQFFKAISKQLNAYFAGKLKNFEVSFDFQSGTAFQQKVWRTLYAIPYGQVISYKELARRINNPAAVRAVGGANGKNPIPIIIPCHRVIAADGSLGGYSSGLKIKEQLLTLEGHPPIKTFKVGDFRKK